MCTCEEIERGTHAYRAPVERWWTQDGKLGITIQDPPPDFRRRTHLLLYLFVLFSVAFLKICHSLLVLHRYEHLFLFFISILQVALSRLCLYLLNIYHFTYTFSHAHTEAHTHKHTCIISTQEEWRQPGTGAWLRGVDDRLLLETKALHTHTNEKKRK